MKKTILVSLLFFMLISALFSSDTGKYKGGSDSITIAVDDKTFNGTATMTATLSVDIIGTWLEVGFSNTSDVGNFYDADGATTGENGGYLYDDSIVLDDNAYDLSGGLDGTATGPDNLYVYYKVLNQEPLTISVSIDDRLHTNPETADIPWRVEFDLVGGTRHYEIASDGTKSEVIYRHTEDSRNYAMAVYKAGIYADYESRKTDNQEVKIPAGVYKANLKITISKN